MPSEPSRDACFDVLNLNSPCVVQSVHADSTPSFGRFEVIAEVFDAIH
jgi:hypothetical protein